MLSFAKHLKKKFREGGSSLTNRRRTNLAFDELEGRLVPSTIPVVYSTNWSGYAVQTPGVSDVTAVSGSWKQPAVTGSSGSYAAFWVGIDGYSSSTVEQIGTMAEMSGRQAVYYVWYEMYPSNMVEITQIKLKPGDMISASVTYNSPSSFTLSISDTTANKSFSIVKTLASAQRSSAEWIVEAPSSGRGVLPLANFGTATFSNASATLGVAGPIDSSSWPSGATTAIDMETNSGSIISTPAALTDTTTTPATSSFTVTYTAPPGGRGGTPGKSSPKSGMWWFGNFTPAFNTMPMPGAQSFLGQLPAVTPSLPTAALQASTPTAIATRSLAVPSPFIVSGQADTDKSPDDPGAGIFDLERVFGESAVTPLADPAPDETPPPVTPAPQDSNTPQTTPQSDADTSDSSDAAPPG